MLMQIAAIGTLGDEVLQNVKNLGERPENERASFRILQY